MTPTISPVHPALRWRRLPPFWRNWIRRRRRSSSAALPISMEARSAWCARVRSIAAARRQHSAIVPDSTSAPGSPRPWRPSGTCCGMGGRRMGKLLITGAMGHVGFETARQAVARGIPVVGQYMNTFRKDDPQSLGPGIDWVKCDLADPFGMALLAAEHQIDGCIHTAAIPNDVLVGPAPLRTFQSNVAATSLLLET